MSRNVAFSGSAVSRGFVRLLIGLAVAAVVGCAAGTPNVKSIPVTANPSEQIDALALRIDQSRQAQAAVLSPTWFGRAEGSLARARELRGQGGAVQQILDNVAQGNAQIEQATKFTRVSENILPTVIKARSDARTAGAPSLGQSYGEVETAFLELTAAIEQDNVSWAERKAASVEGNFRALELQAIKASSATEIRNLIRKARAENAEKLVPKTLAATEKLSSDLDDFITRNRYASQEIGTRAADALFEANRLVSLTREAAAIQKSSPETQALLRERNLASVNAELALPDLRNQDFASQLSSVTNAVRELRKDRDYLVTQTGDLRDKLAVLEQQSKKLASLEEEQRFNELYNEVSAYFSPDEAEVYKQGSQLVVRMRGVQFPVGQSVLQPENYALLSKVQKAIRTFDKPHVVIEGHTDTTGTEAVNELLSQQRAEAVAAYLVANNTLPADQITAVGKGFSQPLATNNTEAGRAYNRRIDVLIDAGRLRGPLPAVAAGKAATGDKAVEVESK